MLKLSNLSAGYNGIKVIDNISFSVEKEQKLAIIGPNGCGKTTLLRAIAGILPFTGEILLDSQSTREINQRTLAKKIALLSQISGLYFSYSIYDTVMMGRYAHMNDKLFGIPKEVDHQKVKQSLKAVGLWEAKDREITELSGGQLQRVFLARTLAQDPKVLLLDEPTNHLDLKYQAELVEHLRKQECIVIGVFHDINLALQLGGSLMIMKEGHIYAMNKINADILKDVYEMDVTKYMKNTLKIWEGIN